MTDKIYEGLPTLSLLPLNSTQFKVIGSTKITVPRAGNYHEMQPKVFDEEHGDYNLLDNNILYLPAITKVLIATNNYPKLEGNQLFAPLSLEFDNDEVVITGSILEIISVGKKPDGN